MQVAKKVDRVLIASKLPYSQQSSALKVAKIVALEREVVRQRSEDAYSSFKQAAL